MGHDEILAARLADQARVALVLGDVLADGLPHGVEHRGAAREVHAREVGGDLALRHIGHIGQDPGPRGRL